MGGKGKGLKKGENVDEGREKRCNMWLGQRNMQENKGGGVSQKKKSSFVSTHHQDRFPCFNYHKTVYLLKEVTWG